MKIAMHFLWIFITAVAALASPQSNEITSPHGLGTFYEEPEGYRPSQKGASKFLLKVTGHGQFSRCMNLEEIHAEITSQMQKFPVRPMLGEKGPNDFPRAHFAFSSPGVDQYLLKLSLYLYLPAEISPQKEVQEVLSFEYQYETGDVEVDCKKSLIFSIDQVVDMWMREYAFYNR